MSGVQPNGRCYGARFTVGEAFDLYDYVVYGHRGTGMIRTAMECKRGKLIPRFTSKES